MAATAVTERATTRRDGEHKTEGRGHRCEREQKEESKSKAMLRQPSTNDAAYTIPTCQMRTAQVLLLILDDRLRHNLDGDVEPVGLPAGEPDRRVAALAERGYVEELVPAECRDGGEDGGKRRREGERGRRSTQLDKGGGEGSQLAPAVTRAENQAGTPPYDPYPARSTASAGRRWR